MAERPKDFCNRQCDYCDLTSETFPYETLRARFFLHSECAIMVARDLLDKALEHSAEIIK